MPGDKSCQASSKATCLFGSPEAGPNLEMQENSYFQLHCILLKNAFPLRAQLSADSYLFTNKIDVDLIDKSNQNGI